MIASSILEFKVRSSKFKSSKFKKFETEIFVKVRSIKSSILFETCSNCSSSFTALVQCD